MVNKFILFSGEKIERNDTSLNRSPEIPPEAVPLEAVFSTGFHYNFRPEVNNDVISGIAVDNVGVDVSV